VSTKFLMVMPSADARVVHEDVHWAGLVDHALTWSRSHTSATTGRDAAFLFDLGTPSPRSRWRSLIRNSAPARAIWIAIASDAAARAVTTAGLR
jgi:hypothetical protein